LERIPELRTVASADFLPRLFIRLQTIVAAAQASRGFR
jgi:hypothetical protein